MHKHADLVKGNSKDVISTNIKKLCECGHSEANATRMALRMARKGTGKKLDAIAKKVVSKPKHDRVEVK